MLEFLKLVFFGGITLYLVIISGHQYDIEFGEQLYLFNQLIDTPHIPQVVLDSIEEATEEAFNFYRDFYDLKSSHNYSDEQLREGCRVLTKLQRFPYSFRKVAFMQPEWTGRDLVRIIRALAAYKSENGII